MTQKTTLLDFVDDELLRAPLAFDQVVDAVLEPWRRALSAAARAKSDGVRVLQRQRSELVGDAVRELRSLVQAEIAGATTKTSPARRIESRPELSLIDDDEISVDIEIARSVEHIKSEAEVELRALQAFTSALVDDLNVSRDTNPFRPEAYVRSLWRGVSGLALSRALQAGFMRDAAVPLALTLRQGYAAACARLEEQGVVPAKYRTIVPGAAGRIHADPPGRDADRLSELRQHMPASQDRATHLPDAAAGSLHMAANDPQLAELLPRLFDAIAHDPKLSPSALALLPPLQASALRVALHDPGLLEAGEHPVWRFIDALVFLLEMVPAAEADRCLAHCRQLVDHLAADSAPDAARFDWALGRLAAFERHLLEQGVAAAQPAIARLQSTIDTANMPIDVGTLDTIPAELMPTASESPTGLPPTLAMHPGVRLRAHLQGDWRLLQVLWCDPIDDHWLLRDLASDQLLALRLRALDRLAAENLAQALRPRSLVRTAAERLMQGMASNRAPGP